MNGRETLDKVVLLRAFIGLMQQHLGDLTETPQHFTEGEHEDLGRFASSLNETDLKLAKIEQRLIEQAR